CPTTRVALARPLAQAGAWSELSKSSSTPNPTPPLAQAFIRQSGEPEPVAVRFVTTKVSTVTWLRRPISTSARFTVHVFARYLLPRLATQALVSRLLPTTLAQHRFRLALSGAFLWIASHLAPIQAR